MAREHSFSIGLPDNIVYCSEFLDTLQDRLDKYAHRLLFTVLSLVFSLWLSFVALCSLQSGVFVLRENVSR